MRTGIYITGLGQSFTNESVEKYAQRLMNEMSFHSQGTEYEMRSERAEYSPGNSTTFVTIHERKGDELVPVYRLYDYQYHEILTSRFNAFSIIVKNAWLLMLVLRKIPDMFLAPFRRRGFAHPYQTLYVFLIFLIIAFSVLVMLPMTIEMARGYLSNLDVEKKEAANVLMAFWEMLQSPLFHVLVPLVTVTNGLLLLIPQAKTFLLMLATEFVCANDYLEHGQQRQLVLGHLDLLLEFIAETEKPEAVDIHTFSFGSIIAIDFLFPFGHKVSGNTERYVKTLITIGTPVEFVDSYYPHFYDDRSNVMADKLRWVNVFSSGDALATNFRKDSLKKEAMYGIRNVNLIPKNINYEVGNIRTSGPIAFLQMNSVRIHGMYWDSSPLGQSCLRSVYHELHQMKVM